MDPEGKELNSDVATGSWKVSRPLGSIPGFLRELFALPPACSSLQGVFPLVPKGPYQPPPAGSPGQGRNHLGPLGQPLAAETLQLWESCGRTSSGGEAGGELYTTGCLHLSRVFLLVPTTTQARAQPSTRELSSKSQHCSGYEACGHQSLRQPHTLLGMGFGV